MMMKNVNTNLYSHIYNNNNNKTIIVIVLQKNSIFE